jgi:hypothetical protein
MVHPLAKLEVVLRQDDGSLDSAICQQAEVLAIQMCGRSFGSLPAPMAYQVWDKAEGIVKKSACKMQAS